MDIQFLFVGLLNLSFLEEIFIFVVFEMSSKFYSPKKIYKLLVDCIFIDSFLCRNKI